MSIVNKISNTNFTRIVKFSSSLSDITRRIGLKNASNTSAIKRKIKQLELTTSHFNPYGCARKRYTNAEVFVINSAYKSNVGIKNRLINDFEVEYKCNVCGISEWKTRCGFWKPIVLELEHINGVNTDNRLENLSLLCLNCHSFTPTFRGKNKKTVEIGL
jgi:hypothetical protein